jgi:hypothetical protein
VAYFLKKTTARGERPVFLRRAYGNKGAIVGTATYTQTGTNDPTAAGSHGVLLAPFAVSQSNYPVPSTADSSTDSGATTATQVITGAGATENGIALITGAPAMPQLTAQIMGFSGGGMTVDWRLAVTSERTERGTKDNIFLPVQAGEGGSGGPGIVDNVPINTAWDISGDYLMSPQSFFGGKVTIYYRIKKADGTYIEPSEQTLTTFKIRGLNPLDATAKNFIVTGLAGGANSDVFQFAWAIVQHESREGNKVYDQFNPSGSTAELPDYGAPDGWGIAQLDHPLGVSANTEEVYNWQLNLSKFYQEIDQKIAAQQRFFAAVAAAYPTDTDAQNPPTTPLYGQSMTALAAGAITLYNGAGAPPGGTPCPTTVLGGVSYQNPWTFTSTPPTGQPKWVYHPNGYDYLHQVVLEYLGESFNE